MKKNRKKTRRRPSAKPKSAPPAATTAQSHPSQLPTSPPELAGVLMLALAALTLSSLFSYQPADLAGGEQPIQNWVGPAGAYIAHWLFTAVGLAAYLLGFWSLRIAYILVMSRTRRTGLRTLIGATAGIISFTGLVQIWLPRGDMPYELGGLVGIVVSSGLISIFSTVGTSIILSAMAILAFSELLGLGPYAILSATHRALSRGRLNMTTTWARLKEQWRLEREQRRERRAEDRAKREAIKATAADELEAAKAEGRRAAGRAHREQQGTIPPDNISVMPRETEETLIGEPATVLVTSAPPSTALSSEPAWVQALADSSPAENEMAQAAEIEPELAPAAESEEAAKQTEAETTAEAEEPDPVIVEMPKPALAVALPIEEEPSANEDEEEKARQALRDRLRKKKMKSRAEWELPSLDLLNYEPPDDSALDTEWLQETAAKIVSKLGEFKIHGRVIEIRPGPTVTLYEFEPGPGIKVSKIAGYSDDLQMALGARSARIIAPLPNKSTVGIEIPNKTRQTVYLKELLADPNWTAGKAALPMALGRDGEGRSFYMDLAKTPHLLVAGGTGSGKSVGVNTMILSLLYRFTPHDLRLLLVDPKMLEFAPYNDIPHLLVPPITEPDKATCALAWSCEEMDRRYELLAAAGVKNIGEYNELVERHRKDRKEARLELLDQMRLEAEAVHAELRAESGPNLKMVVEEGEADETAQMKVVEREDEVVDATASLQNQRSLPADHELAVGKDPEPMPYVIIVVDEFADLMMTAGKEVEGHISRLAAKARAAGLHVILATQRPSVDVVTGVIKVNFPSRMAFRVSAVQDSRTIIERTGAERLLGNGDMLVIPPNASDPSRVQGAFVSTEEMKRILDHLRAQGEPDYDESVLASAAAAGASGGVNHDDPYDSQWMECLRIAAQEGSISTSWLQRRLKIGYNRAGRIIDRMEQEGLVGPSRGAKPREVFVTMDQINDPTAPWGSGG
ncbi:MAG: DNA translocase FtsK [Myxococcota bacterium]|nr:hypothetical protein [Myxococcales bacterium]MEC7750206.1 DNA translocase FtsK [Myxococcota bacterium]